MSVFRRDRDQEARVQRLLQRAESYTGFRARPNRDTPFGKRTGYNGATATWDGSFLETVLIEENLWAGVALISSAAVTGYALRTGRCTKNPRPGDILIFPWSAGDATEAAHIGLVHTVSRDRYGATGEVITIEGMVNPATARGHTEPDGIYLRHRYLPQDAALVFRPRYTDRPARTDRELSAEEFQTFLHRETGVHGMIPGKADALTKSAIRRFKSEVGILDGNGTATEETIAAAARLC